MPTVRGHLLVSDIISISGPKRRIGEDAVDESLLETIQSTVDVIELKYQHY